MCTPARRLVLSLVLWFGVVLVSGCELMLPDLEKGAGDSGAGGDGDTDADGDADGDGDGGPDVEPGENGWSCAEDDECIHDNCTNGVCCAANKLCCDENAHCANDHACNLGVYECYDDCTVGGTNEFDYMCAEGFHCDLFGCVADVQQGPCDEDGDCVSGECPGGSGYCCEHAGLCCAEDADCPEMFDGCATDNSQTCVFSAFDLPDTGQDHCYDVSGEVVDCSSIKEGFDLHGQDGHHAGNAKSYSDRGDGTVEDQVTGLVWARESSASLSFANAETYCDTLETAGLDWRVPARYELHTLVDYGAETKMLIDDSVFDGPDDAPLYWTSAGFSGNPGTVAWVINFQTGAIERLGKVDSAPRARCVAAEGGGK